VPTNYPGGIDEFIEPDQPQNIPLSQAGSGNYNHVQSHTNMGDAIEELQKYAALRNHDHSGTGSDRTKGAKLKQANTHEDADTNQSASAIHHTLGTGQFQAAPGNHTHDYDDGSITNAPYIRCTSSTRPASPTPGLTIYETDTNRMRVWNDFGNGNRWNILPTATIPVVRLAQSINQTISAAGTSITWNEEVEDNFGYFNPATPTAITVTEPGLYSISAALQWSVNFLPEIATVVFCINGQETTLRNSSLQTRPGLLSLFGVAINADFSQTLAVSGKLRVDLGDVITMKCRYGASAFTGAIQTFFDLPSRVKSRLEMNYVGP
jgi:hypothetical protein